MPLPLLSGETPLRCNGGELLQSFRRICIQQFFPPLGVNDLYLLRVSLEHNTAALALGQGAQSGKIFASKQNGTSDNGVRAMCGPGSQPEDARSVSFCVWAKAVISASSVSRCSSG